MTRSPRAPRRRRRGVRAAAAVAAVTTLAAGCTAAHPSIHDSSVSACFRALPTAKDAIHDPDARFQGVLRIPADVVERRFHISVLPTDAEVCAFAFRGSFRPGQVDAAPANEGGPYAVVLVTSSHLTLLRSFVGARLPTRFSHRYA